MKQLAQRVATVTTTMVLAVAGAVVLTGSPAFAAPKNNSVSQTAFIWNCPTGAVGCSSRQARVGDVRTSDGQITDVCRVTNSDMNLVYNRTNRSGAADRTGFLYRTNLQSPGLQTDSCTSLNSGQAFANIGKIQRLCPWINCGGVGSLENNQQAIKSFCTTDIGDALFVLTVIFNPATGGPQTAGFMLFDDMNNVPPLPDCESP